MIREGKTVDPQHDYAAETEKMKERITQIKSDPERALFSDFKGTAPSGAVTAWVDLLGRLKRITFKPGVLYEGGEPWLTNEIMLAYQDAAKAANFLDFNLAEFARELNEAPALKQRMDNEENERSRQRGQSAQQDDDTYYEETRFLR